MSRILLFLSTGRCGTQFLTDVLARSAGAQAAVSHEPLGPRYRPRECLRHQDLAAKLHELPEVSAHFERWSGLLADGQAVVETGWPVFPWIPYLHRRFAGHLDVVHLTRDPIRFAFSFASHDYFSNHRDDEFTRFGPLHPGDPGVRYREYEAVWHGLNPLERSLFQWLEVNAFGDELERQGSVALRVQSEAVFADPAEFIASLRSLHPDWARVLSSVVSDVEPVDRFHCQLREPVDSMRYPKVLAELAARFGYTIDIERQLPTLIERFFAD